MTISGFIYSRFLICVLLDPSPCVDGKTAREHKWVRLLTKFIQTVGRETTMALLKKHSSDSKRESLASFHHIYRLATKRPPIPC